MRVRVLAGLHDFPQEKASSRGLEGEESERVNNQQHWSWRTSLNHQQQSAGVPPVQSVAAQVSL